MHTLRILALTALTLFVTTACGGSEPPSRPDDNTPDAGTGGGPDSGVPDPGVPDSGAPDPGVPDSGVPDPGVPDSGVPNPGVPDSGVPNSGVPDSGVPDSGVPATAPGAPTAVTATAGNGQATVTWQAPASNGGSPITGYTVTASPGGAQVSVGADSLSATLTGLANGTSYTFVVAAQNAQGPGPASEPSSPVVPATVPAAPTQVVATATEDGASVSWSAPQDNGGSALTGYRLTSDPTAVQLTL
ncbi:MAG TPA: fibronectin type III domain-containing protein, partial [Myxococcaceae bacterium]